MCDKPKECKKITEGFSGFFFLAIKGFVFSAEEGS